MRTWEYMSFPSGTTIDYSLYPDCLSRVGRAYPQITQPKEIARSWKCYMLRSSWFSQDYVHNPGVLASEILETWQFEATYFLRPWLLPHRDKRGCVRVPAFSVCLSLTLRREGYKTASTNPLHPGVCSLVSTETLLLQFE